MVGRTLGHYEILEPLGAGGMGEVYRARDTHLERDVAIKVLPEDFAADSERLARFEREAKLLAQLNHPHIASILGLEESDGTRFIAMECVEGMTLADKIEAEGRIEVDEALGIARQIAEALEAAHEAGIIHRDLKPANVKVTPEGQVKVLDFGLAKAFEPDGSSSGISPDLSHSPTMAAATRTGVIMGTAAYMSPEQARGKPVDKRTDIWAFGCVLFEMLTGGRAFDGETVSDVMASILKEDPDWGAVPEGSPPMLAGVLRRCLTKNPRQRLRDIGDACLIIDGSFGLLEAHERRSAAAGRGWLLPRPAPLFLSALAVALVTAVVVWWIARGFYTAPAGAAPEPTRYVDLVLPETAPLVFVGEASLGVGQPAVAFSPDGRRIVYVGEHEESTRLYERAIDGTVFREIPGTDSAYGPFFAPNGESVGFFVRNQLMQASLVSGQVLPIGEANDPDGAAWSDDGRIAVATNDHTRLLVGSADVGGIERLDTTVGDWGVAQPVWLPNTDWLLLTCGWGPAHICAVSAASGELLHLVVDDDAVPELGEHTPLLGTNPRMASPEVLVYVAPNDNQLMGVRFQTEGLRTRGSPVPLLDGFRRENIHGTGQLSVSRTGDLIYAEGSNSEFSRFVWTDGTREDPLPFERRAYGMFRLSPDKNRIAAIVHPRPTGDFELWFLDIETGRERRWVPPEGGTPTGPGLGPWLPDTNEVLLSFEVHGEGVRMMAIDATRAAGGRTLWAGTRWLWPFSVSQDGRVLIQSWWPELSRGFLSLVPLQALSELGPDPVAELQPLVESSGLQGLPDLSPDAKWLVYTSGERGPYQVVAVPLPPDRPPIEISPGGGEAPRWSPRGDGFYYRDRQRWYWVALTGSDERPFAEPVFVLEGDYLNVAGPEFDVSADGRSLLVLAGPGERTQGVLKLVTNWRAELDRLFADDRLP